MAARDVQRLVLFVAMAVGVTLANRYLTFHFDPVSQNFYRFAAGGALLLGLCVPRREPVRALLAAPIDLARAVLCGALIAGVMVMSITGLGGISAATASVLTAAGTPTTIALSMLFYPDERCARPGAFGLGMAGLLAATVGYGWAATGSGGSGVDHLWGVALFGTAVVLRAAVALVVKDVVRRHDSLAVSAVNAPVAAAVLWLWAHSGGSGLAPPQSGGTFVAVVLLVSGAVGIWVGVALYNRLVGDVGLVRLHLATAAVPPMVAVTGWLLLAEGVTALQCVLGAAIIGCVILLIRLKHQWPARSAGPADEALPVTEEPPAAVRSPSS